MKKFMKDVIRGITNSRKKPTLKVPRKIMKRQVIKTVAVITPDNTAQEIENHHRERVIAMAKALKRRYHQLDWTHTRSNIEPLENVFHVTTVIHFH